MKVIYDPEVDVLRIVLNDQSVEESDEEKAGVIFDYDLQGNVIGMEILDASRRVADPRSVDYSLVE
jgi:uncharacterized protein YuzE